MTSLKRIVVAAVAVLALLPAASTSAAGPPAASATERFFVAFATPPGASERALVARQGGEVLSDLSEVGALNVRLNPAAAEALARHPGVAYVEPDPQREFLGLSNTQLVPSLDNGLYGLVTTRATAAHARGRTGQGIRACVGDTGLDYTHPDISARYRGGIDTRADDNDPWWLNAGKAPEHHGTHVAGIVLAAFNSAGVYGMAYGADLYFARVGDEGGAYSGDVIDGVRWLVEQAKCKVVNLSLGGNRPSRTEERFYQSMRNKGALIVAASGNDTATSVQYPAAYPVNVAVGAVDQFNGHASFSNTGRNLDVSAPGVANLSAVPKDEGSEASVSSGTDSYNAAGFQFAGYTDARGITGALVDCGLGYAGQCPAAVAGNVALIRRGEIAFAQKVETAMNAGAAAAIVYNNVPGDFAGSVMTATTSDGRSWIPAVGVSDATGVALKGRLGTSVTVANTRSSWMYMNGTSMATPHVTGALAVIWSANPAMTPATVEDHLFKTAKDLGPAGYDTTYGYGLVDVEAAVIRAGG